MSLVLFLGPTLPRREVEALAEALADATILPPAAQGDIWRAAQSRPGAIGIVDGYFQGAPSVWHKEILWALAEGIAVFGSASMGALRAAELHPFGMQGVGRIFEDFRDGRLEDDDEVAVTHGPAELGYPALSEAMVNIRATLARAEAEGVLKPAQRKKIEAHAKALHFPERRWESLLQGVPGVARAALDALGAWLPEGRIDLKREDALAMIRAMQAAPAPPEIAFRFERTHLWDEMSARIPPNGTDAPRADETAVVEELRLEGPDIYEAARTRALARLMSSAAAERLGLGITREAMRETLTRLRSERGLHNRATLDAWLAENDLDAAAMERLVEEEARLEAVGAAAGVALDAALANELRLSGAWPRLARRAREKAAVLARRGPVPPPEPLALRHWYFARRLGRPLPDDLAAFAQRLGFATLADFDKALRREISYVELVKDSDS